MEQKRNIIVKYIPKIEATKGLYRFEPVKQESLEIQGEGEMHFESVQEYEEKEAVNISPEHESLNLIENTDFIEKDEDNDKIIWYPASIKILLSLVCELLPQVGTSPALKRKVNMWTEIKHRMATEGYNYSEAQIENKYRNLERKYKEMKARNLHYTGAKRPKFVIPYEKELSQIISENACRPDLNSDNEETSFASQDFISEKNNFSNGNSCGMKDFQNSKQNKNISDALFALNEQRKKESIETKRFRDDFLETIKEAVQEKQRRAIVREKLLVEKNKLLREILQELKERK